MALRIAQGQWEKYLTLELARTRNRVEDMYAIVSKFQFAKIGGDHRSSLGNRCVLPYDLWSPRSRTLTALSDFVR